MKSKRIELIIIVLAALALLSCGQGRKVRPEQVENIVFYAMPKGIERPSSLVSFQDLKRQGRDTLITDRRFIRRFTRMVNRLTPDDGMESIDMRSAAVIATAAGDSLFIAFGENWSTVILKDNGADLWEYREDLGFSMPSMYVNGDFMKDDPALFRFIDGYVYGPHSNDYWFSDTTREIIRFARELERSGGTE